MDEGMLPNTKREKEKKDVKFGMKVVRSAMEGQVLKSVNIKEESNKID